MGQLIGFGSDCFGCGVGEDPALPGSVDPSSILPANLTPATTTQVAAMAESAKKDMLFYAVGAVGIALLIDWLVFGKKSYKANGLGRRGHGLIERRFTSAYAGRQGRRVRIHDRKNWNFAERYWRMTVQDRDEGVGDPSTRIAKAAGEGSRLVGLLRKRGMSAGDARDLVMAVIQKVEGA